MDFETGRLCVILATGAVPLVGLVMVHVFGNDNGDTRKRKERLHIELGDNIFNFTRRNPPRNHTSSP